MEQTTEVTRFCYNCRHWPGAETGHPKRIERCKKGHGQTLGFAKCADWQIAFARLSDKEYEENLMQHGIIRG